MWLDNIRILSILGVVCLHVTANIVLEEDLNSADWMIANILDSSLRWAAPVFIILSGYLLLEPSKHKESITVFYSKRISKIGIAIIFWSLFYIILQVGKDYIKGRPLTVWNNFFLPIYNGEPYFHLWFIYTILVLYLCTPILRILLKQVSLKSVFTITFILFTIAAFYNIISEKKHFFFIESLKYLPYFIAGYLFRFVKIIKKYFIFSFILFFMSVAFTAIGTYMFSLETKLISSYFYSYLGITVILMSLTIFYIFLYLKPNIFNHKYQSTVFGIYLIHPFFLDLFRLIGFKAEHYPPLLSIPLFTIVIVSLSYLLVILIQKYKRIKKVLGI